MEDLPDNAQLFLDSNRGMYIPRDFALTVNRECLSGVTEYELAVLEQGPDHDLYWDVWNDVECNAVLYAATGDVTFRLYQDGELWLFPQECCGKHC